MRWGDHTSDRLFISTSFQGAALFLACASLLRIARQFGYPNKPIPEKGFNGPNHLRKTLEPRRRQRQQKLDEREQVRG
jgi:hypothetical protein